MASGNHFSRASAANSRAPSAGGPYGASRAPAAMTGSSSAYRPSGYGPSASRPHAPTSGVQSFPMGGASRAPGSSGMNPYGSRSLSSANPGMSGSPMLSPYARQSAAGASRARASSMAGSSRALMMSGPGSSAYGSSAYGPPPSRSAYGMSGASGYGSGSYGSGAYGQSGALMSRPRGSGALMSGGYGRGADMAQSESQLSVRVSVRSDGNCTYVTTESCSSSRR